MIFKVSKPLSGDELEDGGGDYLILTKHEVRCEDSCDLTAHTSFSVCEYEIFIIRIHHLVQRDDERVAQDHSQLKSARS